MRRSSALLAAALALGACARAQADVRERSLTVDGKKRTYRLHVPASLPKEGKVALVLAFHGGGGQAAGMERLSRFDDVADHEGFLVAYPDGLGRHWNDGREPSRKATGGVDDVAFVAALLDALGREYPVDEKRVYATGMSNGGIFSHHLGIRLASRLAAIAPVAGGIADLHAPQPAPGRPVSVLMINGTEDPLVPYGGGPVARSHGAVLPAGEAVAFWKRADGIAAAGESMDLPDNDPGDGCRVRLTTWGGGREGTVVALYRIEGGGHTWPGGSQYLPKLVIGRTCRDFDASKAIWEFFRAHPRP